VKHRVLALQISESFLMDKVASVHLAYLNAIPRYYQLDYSRPKNPHAGRGE